MRTKQLVAGAVIVGGVGLIGTILIIIVILMLLGRL